jgi:hypothetical protein
LFSNDDRTINVHPGKKRRREEEKKKKKKREKRNQ